MLTAPLRQYFRVSIFRACAASQASGHASRLNTMQSADKNLDERIDEVTTLFRRLRQEAITTEPLDVVSGFEAATAKNHDWACRSQPHPSIGYICPRLGLFVGLAG
jgi:F-type H+-transporting ATPase subunit gamma